jgi:hypothetical protein
MVRMQVALRHELPAEAEAMVARLPEEITHMVQHNRELDARCGGPHMRELRCKTLGIARLGLPHVLAIHRCHAAPWQEGIRWGRQYSAASIGGGRSVSCSWVRGRGLSQSRPEAQAGALQGGGGPLACWNFTAPAGGFRFEGLN